MTLNKGASTVDKGVAGSLLKWKWGTDFQDHCVLFKMSISSYLKMEMGYRLSRSLCNIQNVYIKLFKNGNGV